MPRFEEVLNSLLRISNLDVYVTGSNSKFLSSDVVTEFRGRGDEIRICGGENDEEMDKNIVDNSYSYFTFVCGDVLFYRDASFHGVYSIGYLWRYFKSER